MILQRRAQTQVGGCSSQMLLDDQQSTLLLQDSGVHQTRRLSAATETLLNMHDKGGEKSSTIARTCSKHYQ